MSAVAVDRGLDRHGRAYGDLHLAIAFTDGIEGDDAKRVTRKGSRGTRPDSRTARTVPG